MATVSHHAFYSIFNIRLLPFSLNSSYIICLSHLYMNYHIYTIISNGNLAVITTNQIMPAFYMVIALALDYIQA